MDPWKLVGDYGFMATFCVCVLLSIRAIAQWAAVQYEWWKKEIVVPVASKHIEFMDSSSRTAESNSETLKQTSETLKQIAAQNTLRDDRDESIHEHISRIQCLAMSKNGRTGG